MPAAIPEASSSEMGASRLVRFLQETSSRHATSKRIDLNQLRIEQGY